MKSDVDKSNQKNDQKGQNEQKSKERKRAAGVVNFLEANRVKLEEVVRKELSDIHKSKRENYIFVHFLSNI